MELKQSPCARHNQLIKVGQLRRNFARNKESKNKVLNMQIRSADFFSQCFASINSLKPRAFIT